MNIQQIKLTMATEELKSLLHQQIDRLDDPQDSTNQLIETPDLVELLGKTLSTVSSSQLTAHSDVAQQAKQWISQ